MYEFLVSKGFIEVRSGECGGSKVSVFQHPKHTAVEVEVRAGVNFFEVWDGRLGRMSHVHGTSADFKAEIERLLAPVPGC